MASLAGSFLIARPALDDPNFAQSVVLLLQHGTEGAFGLIVNRPIRVEGFLVPLHVGGPCEMPGMFLLHGYPQWYDEGSSPGGKIASGIFLGNEEIMTRLKEAADEYPRFRVFTNYSGWGPDQLEREIASGAWAVVSANGAKLFDTPVEHLWQRLLPSSIPQPSVN
jgi:putative transcriptional regulator